MRWRVVMDLKTAALAYVSTFYNIRIHKIFLCRDHLFKVVYNLPD